MSIKLRVGDCVSADGVTEGQYHKIATRFILAGCSQGEFPRIQECKTGWYIGWSTHTLEGFAHSTLHPDDSCSFFHGGRLLTVEQVLGGEQENPPTTIEQLLSKSNKHAVKAAKHEKKRQELVEKAKELLPDGWVLSEAGEVVEESPEEDMTDPTNWRAGDVVVSLVDRLGGYGEWFNKGALLRVLDDRLHGGVYLAPATVNVHQDGLYFPPVILQDVEWISRPAKETK